MRVNIQPGAALDLAHDLALVVVEAGRDLALDELLELGREVDVHGSSFVELSAATGP